LLEKIEFDEEAEIFFQALNSELNSTRFGRKRSSDVVYSCDHYRNIASSMTINGLSPRGCSSITDFAKMIALYLNDSKVRIGHLVAVAPYCLQHRVMYTKDEIETEREAIRGETDAKKELWSMTLSQHLSEKLVRKVRTNLEVIKDKILKLRNFVASHNDGSSTEKRNLLTGEARSILETTLDHPLLKEYADVIQKYYR